MDIVNIPITNCSKCPHFKSERYYTEDSFEMAFDWHCKKADKKIAGYVEWNEEKDIKIPKWCPFNKEIESNFVVWKDGSYKEVFGETWEFENDKNWLVTIPK